MNFLPGIRSKSAFVILAGVLLNMTLFAQPPGRLGAGSPERGQMWFSSSYSAETELERGAARLGEVSVAAFEVGIGSATATASGYRMDYGVEFGEFRLDRSAVVPLPAHLRHVSVPLGISSRFSETWSGRLMARPGLYGTSPDASGRQFNMPVLAIASYRQSDDLTWLFGLRYDAWARNEVIPFAGVNWKFAPNWEFTVGLPRSGVSWQLREDTILRFGASIQGGSFDVNDDPRRVPVAAPALNRTKLDYREIRVGAALDLFARGPVSIVADVGAIVSQRFDYHKRGYRLSGDTAPYGSLSVRARF